MVLPQDYISPDDEEIAGGEKTMFYTYIYIYVDIV